MGYWKWQEKLIWRRLFFKRSSLETETSLAKIFPATADLCKWAQRCIFLHTPFGKDDIIYVKQTAFVSAAKFHSAGVILAGAQSIQDSWIKLGCCGQLCPICHDCILAATVLLWAPWQLLKKNTQAVYGATATCNFSFSEESLKLSQYRKNKKKGSLTWIRKGWPCCSMICPPSLICYVSLHRGIWQWIKRALYCLNQQLFGIQSPHFLSGIDL